MVIGCVTVVCDCSDCWLPVLVCVSAAHLPEKETRTLWDQMMMRRDSAVVKNAPFLPFEPHAVLDTHKQTLQHLNLTPLLPSFTINHHSRNTE